MPSFSAAIFITRPRPFGTEQNLVAHALLLEGHRPHWQMHMEDEIFRFIPDPLHIIEDGLLQLLPKNLEAFLEKCKQSTADTSAPVLSELYGESACNELRQDLTGQLQEYDFKYRIITWPGAGLSKLNQQIMDWQKAGVAIELMDGDV